MLSEEQLYSEAGILSSKHRWFKLQKLRKKSSDDTDQAEYKRISKITKQNTIFNRDVGKLIIDSLDSSSFKQHSLEEGLKFQHKYSSQKGPSQAAAFGPHFQNHEYLKLVISEASTAEWENIIDESGKSIPQSFLDTSADSKQKVAKHVRFNFS